MALYKTVLKGTLEEGQSGWAILKSGHPFPWLHYSKQHTTDLTGGEFLYCRFTFPPPTHTHGLTGQEINAGADAGAVDDDYIDDYNDDDNNNDDDDDDVVLERKICYR
ncbi:hypothetical protein DPMN_123175 [Dreissena polymorpha]|uniref:Uncharacterized protein n=1 Tax=Dreissena polymorpha TaxID=45954 RepID=A0A9D4GTY1_DREPO|nr:hypothetical protein DPMN_123175 [Dreissena polymorpha]